jgi:hypothetical protein
MLRSLNSRFIYYMIHPGSQKYVRNAFATVSKVVLLILIRIIPFVSRSIITR